MKRGTRIRGLERRMTRTRMHGAAHERVETKKGARCRVLEAGSGMPLVFFHGAGGLLADNPFLDQLAARYHVFAPELPGYGESTGEELLEDMLDFTLHGWDVVAALGLARPHLVGHSMGGMIAAEMAAIAPGDLGQAGAGRRGGALDRRAPDPRHLRAAPRPAHRAALPGSGEGPGAAHRRRGLLGHGGLQGVLPGPAAAARDGGQDPLPDPEPPGVEAPLPGDREDPGRSGAGRTG